MPLSAQLEESKAYRRICTTSLAANSDSCQSLRMTGKKTKRDVCGLTSMAAVTPRLTLESWSSAAPPYRTGTTPVGLTTTAALREGQQIPLGA